MNCLKQNHQACDYHKIKRRYILNRKVIENAVFCMRRSRPKAHRKHVQYYRCDSPTHMKNYVRCARTHAHLLPILHIQKKKATRSSNKHLKCGFVFVCTCENGICVSASHLSVAVATVLGSMVLRKSAFSPFHESRKP